MEKRYQVFVSSTYEDLLEERPEVMQALLKVNCIPTGMELFPAADDDSLTIIQRFIADCDYYIVIVGGRYGFCTSACISFRFVTGLLGCSDASTGAHSRD